jgi:hypothetical protein
MPFEQQRELAFPANPKLPETPPRYAPFGFAQEA